MCQKTFSSIPVKVSRKLKSEVKLDFCIKLNSWNLLSSRSESKKYIIDDTVTFSKKLKLNAIARSYVYQRLPGSINILPLLDIAKCISKHDSIKICSKLPHGFQEWQNFRKAKSLIEN